jgi:hypothetical protein
MVRFLSEDWLAALESALRDAPGLDGPAPPGERLWLGQIVTGAGTAGVPGSPALVGDEVRYTIGLGGGQPPQLRLGTVDGATVTLVTSYPAAATLAAGSATVGELLAGGKLKVRGDVNALIAAQDVLASLAPALATLAASTSTG